MATKRVIQQGARKVTESQKFQPIEFALRRIQLDLSAPSVAHAFGWARVGEEFLLEVGYLDMFGASQIIQRRNASDSTTAESAPSMVDWFVTHRFVMSIESTERLAQVLEGLSKEVKEFKTRRESTDANRKQ